MLLLEVGDGRSVPADKREPSSGTATILPAELLLSLGFSFLLIEICEEAPPVGLGEK